MNKVIYILIISFFLPVNVFAQRTITISGTVTDGASTLNGATVFVTRTNIGTETDNNGRYTLSLPSGTHTIFVSFIGYQNIETTVRVFRDTVIHFQLKEASVNLTSVIVSSERPNVNITRPDMGLEKLDRKQIQQIPALMGEVDILKVIQMLPGVQAANEGSSGFSVRGGTPDQNLILFEDATIYNASHLMGFFSVFNNDAVDNIALYKGDIPPAYGGRLSSMLEVTAREGRQDFSGSAGVGLIASRLVLEGPIIPDRLTFLVAGRRTYADLFLALAADENLRKVDIHFYDLNAKLQGRLNDRNYLSFTGYYGRDVFRNGDMGMNFGNTAYTLRWKHLFSEKFFTHLEFIGSHYDYKMEATTSSIEGIWKAGINDYGLRSDFIYLPNTSNSYRFGYNTIFHQFVPGNAAGRLPEGMEYTIDIAHQQAWENSLYFSNQHNLFEKLTIKYGLRVTRFDNIGPSTAYSIGDAYQVTDTSIITSGKFYHHYYGIEPRAGAVWTFNESWSVKASYSRTMQFVHLLTTSTAGSPLDIWVPSNPTIKPETAQQAAAGVFANFLDNQLETSVEVYYKKLNNVIDFKDHPEVLGNDVTETEIRNGSGQNYGIELMFRKNGDIFNGWVSYTWSRAFRTIKEINNGAPYSSPFDRPHNINIVLTYNLSKRLSLSVNWIYSTGQPVTFPEARYAFGNNYIPVYTARNTYRFPDYHRMDAAVTLQLGKLTHNKKWKHELNFSVYNLYARKNPWIISFRTDTDGSQYAQMTYLFGIVPSITYNLSFNNP